MYFVETLVLKGLGNRSYLPGGRTAAVAVDPRRDIDRVMAVAARRGMRITHVVETHLHNDYVTGGTPAWAQVDLPVRTGQGQVM
jgi:glyoxylase-like metal-dependent hydrolase (beta-lactamase superfamily II)